MKPKTILTMLAMCSFLFLNTSDVLAQKNSNTKKEYKKKAHKKKIYTTKDHQKSDQKDYGSKEVIIGRVISPRSGNNSPRKLKGVPKGHYPPPGTCKIWYPNRPPGHQPPATNCSKIYRTKLEPGAFILHGDRAYDADYNWREEERRRPGTVERVILDILFPRSR